MSASFEDLEVKVFSDSDVKELIQELMSISKMLQAPHN